MNFFRKPKPEPKKPKYSIAYFKNGATKVTNSFLDKLISIFIRAKKPVIDVIFSMFKTLDGWMILLGLITFGFIFKTLWILSDEYLIETLKIGIGLLTVFIAIYFLSHRKILIFLLLVLGSSGYIGYLYYMVSGTKDTVQAGIEQSVEIYDEIKKSTE